ncbi:MAG: putative sulfate exporter family transporter [Silvibacterium sp.]
MHVEKTQSFLISAGTAVCGGSAIAALGPVTAATDGQMAVSMGTVYILNSAALFLFPAIGAALHLSQTQFGLWSALAIHDTSSVVGAAAKYGATALEVGTTVKQARALWIVPLTVGIAIADRKTGQRGMIHLPWFILYFVAAAVANSYLPLQHLHWASGLYPSLTRLGKLGLAVTLFLVGTGITRQTIREVGARPMIQGILLWVVAASASLWAIWRGYIHL